MRWFFIFSFWVVLIAVGVHLLTRVRYKVYDPDTSPEKLHILVTGTSSGIGKHLALSLASRGFHVFASLRDLSQASTTFNKLPKNAKGSVIPVLLDVTNQQQRKDFAQLLREKAETEPDFKFVALVNNAGVSSVELFETSAESTVRYVFDVNFFSLVELTKMCLPYLRQSQGRIINIGSLAGFATRPLSSTYSSSKAALESLSDGMRRELLSFGVSVSVVEPGVVESEMTNQSKGYDKILDNVSKELQAGYKDILERYLKKRKAAFKIQVKPEESTTPAVLDAILNPFPRTRYQVAGYGMFPGWIVPWLKGLFPDRLQDFIIMNV